MSVKEAVEPLQTEKVHVMMSYEVLMMMRMQVVTGEISSPLLGLMAAS
jgi:hypothetical protein